MTNTSTVARALGGIIAVVALTAATGCGANTPNAQHHARHPSPSASPSTPSVSTSITPKPDSTTTKPHPSEAVAAAQKIWAAWSDNKVTYKVWWARLKPLLSPPAVETYQNTDPANIPDLKVTGPMRVDNHVSGPDAQAPGGANVDVPTNRGLFILFLERDNGRLDLLGIRFPKGVQ